MITIRNSARRYVTIGKTGLVACVLLMLAMSFSSHLLLPAKTLAGDMGLCLPSPNLWPLNPDLSWIVNISLLIATATGAVLLNRHFNFIKSTDFVLPGLFLVFAGSNIWVTSWLGASTLLLLVNFICVSVLFGCYKRENATQPMFVIATLLSVGSMFQYAFLVFVPIYIAGALIMKALSWKSSCAMLMGLAAPYWVAIGFGMVGPNDFKVPELSNLFDNFTPPADMLLILINIGVTMLSALMVSLNCIVKLFTGNSRILAINNVINLIGLACCAGILLDYNNMQAYLATFYFIAAAQWANLFALWEFRRGWVAAAAIAAIYTGLAVAQLM